MKLTDEQLHALEELEARAKRQSDDSDGDGDAGYARWAEDQHAYDRALRNAAPDLIASARRVVKLEAEREAMQLEIDQGRDAREMMNDSIDALRSRLAAAERVVEAARRVAEGRVSLESCDLIRDALTAYDRTAGATDADGGGKSDAQ